MDQQKLKALFEWVKHLVNIENCETLGHLGDKSISCFVQLLQYLDKSTSPDSCQTDIGLKLVQKFLEDFYNVDFTSNRLVNFESLNSGGTNPENCKEDVAKVFLLLLCAGVQEKNTDILSAAVQLDPSFHWDIRQLIEAVVRPDDPTFLLPLNFADVFFQHSANGINDSTEYFTHLVSERSASRSTDQSSVFSNNQFSEMQGTPLNARIASLNLNLSSLNDSAQVSSPQRFPVFGSPITPLEEFMNSPQLAKKILRREKEQKFKLERQLKEREERLKKCQNTLRTETHLRDELELDLQERLTQLEQKNSRIKELEDQLQRMRSLQERLDELSLQTSNEEMEHDVEGFRDQVQHLESLKQYCQSLTDENKILCQELSECYTKLETLDATCAEVSKANKSNQTLKMRISELELQVEMLQAARDKVSDDKLALETEVEHLRNINLSQRCQLAERSTILEDESGAFGENMSVVIEKLLFELRNELDTMKNTWTDPNTHAATLQKLMDTVSTKQILEENVKNLEEKIKELTDQLHTLTLAKKNVEKSLRESEEYWSLQLKNLQEEFDTAMHEQRIAFENELSEQSAEHDKRISSVLEEQEGLRLGQKAILEDQLAAVKEELHSEKNAALHSLELEMKEKYDEDIGNFRAKVFELEELLSLGKSANSDLQETVKHYTNKFNESQARECQLENELKHYTNKYNESQAHECQLENELKHYTNKYNESQAHECQLENELKHYTNKYNESHAHECHLENELKHYTNKYNESRAHESQLENELKHYSNKYNESQARECKLENELKSQKLKYESQIASLHDEKHSLQELQVKKDAELHSLGLEIKELKKKYDETIADFQAKVFDLEELLSLAKSANSDLQETVERYTNKYTESQAHESQLENELKYYTNKYNESHAHECQLENELKHYTNKYNESQAHECQLENELKHYTNKYNESQAHECQLENELKHYTNKYNESQAHECQLENELKHYTNKYNESHAHECQLENELKLQKLTYESQLASLHDEKHSLQELHSKKEAEVHSLELEVKELKGKYDKDITDFKTKVFDLEELLNLSKSENSDLQETVKQYTNKYNQSQAHECQLENELRSQQLTYESQLASLHDEKHSLQELHSVKEAALHSLELKMKEVKEKYDEDIADFKTKMFQLEELLSHEKSTNSDLQETVKQYTNKYNESQAHECQLENELKHYTNKYNESQAHECQLENELRSQQLTYESQLATLHDENHSLQELQSKKEAALHSLELEVREVKEKYDEDIANFKAKVLELEELLSLGKSENSDLQETMKHYTNKYNESHAHECQLENELKHYTKKYDESHAHECQLENELKSQQLTFESQLASLHDEKHSLQELQAMKELEVKEMKEKYDEDIANFKTKVLELEGLLSFAKSENSYFQETVKHYTNKYNESQAHECQLENELKHYTNKYNESHAHECQLENELKHYTDKYNESHAHECQLENELKHYTNKYNESHAHECQLENELKHYTDKYNESHAHECQLENELKHYTNKYNESHAHECQLENELKSQQLTYESQLKSLHDEKQEFHSKKEAMLQSLELEIKEVGEKYDRDISEYKAKVLELEELLSFAKSENSDFQETVKHYTNKYNESHAHECQLENELKSQQLSFESQLTSLHDEKHSLQELHSQMEMEMRMMKEKYDEDIANFKAKVISLEELLGQHKSEILQLQERVEDYNIKDSNSQVCKNQLMNELQSQKQSYETQLASVTKEKKYFQELHSQKETALHKLEVEIEELRGKYDHNTAKLDAKVLELEESLDLRKSQISQLQETLQDYTVKCSNSQTCESQLVTELKTQKQSYELQMASLNKEKKYLQELQVRNEAALHNMEVEMEELRRKYDDRTTKLNSKVLEQEGQLGTDKSEITRLKEMVKQYSIKYNESQARENHLLHDFRQQQQSHESQVQQLTRQLVSLNTEKTAFLEKESQKEKALNNLELEMKALKNKYDEDITNLKSKVTELEGLLDLGKSEVSHYPDAKRRHTIKCSESQARESKAVDEILQQKSDDNQFATLNSENNIFQPYTDAWNSKDSDIFDPNESIYTYKSSRYSMYSVGSSKSNSVIPTGAGKLFSCEDEPPESPKFEWGRLKELQRRNTLCLPHMKSSYPIETQVLKNDNFSDDAMQQAQILSDTTGHSSVSTSSAINRKRKPESMEVDVAPLIQMKTSEPHNRKVARHGPPYQKPGPPTPVNDRLRKSSKDDDQNLKSKTPRRSPRLRSISKANIENVVEDPRRESIAFSIGFSPAKTSGLCRLRRQTGFVAHHQEKKSSDELKAPLQQPSPAPSALNNTNSKPQHSTSQGTRKPLGVRNYLQTNL